MEKLKSNSLQESTKESGKDTTAAENLLASPEQQGCPSSEGNNNYYVRAPSNDLPTFPLHEGSLVDDEKGGRNFRDPCNDLEVISEKNCSSSNENTDKCFNHHVSMAESTWFCRNCTMPNYDNALCHNCTEHRDSGILIDGFLAPPSCQAELCASAKSHWELPGEMNDRPSTSLATRSTSQESLSEKCTLIGYDERMLLHSEVQMKSHPHPERPDRLQAIIASFKAVGLFPTRSSAINPREITFEELLKVHSLEHVKIVESTSCHFSSYFTLDTYANEHSALAARVAAGLCADLATAIVKEQSKNGFALVRPPGHHAGVTAAMGFCLHNNAAIACRVAQASGARKVLILDWDVHHGNGTQEIFETDSSVLYISLHRHEGGNFYPGTGAASEVGILEGEGYSVNIPWKCGGVGDNDYIFAFNHIVIPIARQFAPDLIIVSAGFDAAKGDPLGGCEVTPYGFASMTHMLSGICCGKLLVILEGGYNLRSISASATAVMEVLLGKQLDINQENIVPSMKCLDTLLEVIHIQSKYWPILRENLMTIVTRWKYFFPSV
eukprot:TRINITY_DN13324_c0_g1_i1.p1 TRINITY_DN13324_c0_g1~~TRINITY_DN13324_c0_g1_i1.p1  ORF type:complete len:553 (-),score=134.00 TRINITY_DN13324_c0_g1_i1:302-1960(-)